MEEQELQKEKSEPKPKKFTKWTWIKFAIAMAIGLLIAGLIFITLYFNELSQYGEEPIMSKVFARYATDAFGLSGILLLLFAAINFTASKGAFDALNYSVQLLFLTIFRPRYRENNFPKTYCDYKVKMDAKERKPLNVLWLSGAIYLIVGIVFLIIYNASI